MLKLVIKTISKELENRRHNRYIQEQINWKLKYADEQKQKAILAYRNEQYATGKLYMGKYDIAMTEIVELKKQFRDLTQE